MTWLKLRTPRTPRNTQPKARRPRFRPQVEALEDRRVPALIGADFGINPGTHAQDHSAAAASTNGASVVAFEDHFSGSDTDIKAQLFRADGSTVSFDVVNSTANEHDPAVAMDRNGRFVVVWTEDIPGFLGVGAQADIKGQRFNADGSKRGGVMTIANSGFAETEPSVAMRDNGDFVVTYTIDMSGLFSTRKDIRARMRRFSDGTQTANFFVTSTSGIVNSASSVARADDGRFMVAFESAGDIKLRRFSATGASLGSTLTVAHKVNFDKRNPSVAVDNQFRGVVAWQNVASTSRIETRTVNANGSLNDAVLVAGSNDHQHSNPVVAMDRDASDFRFVVAFQTHSVAAANGNGDEDLTPLDDHISVIEHTSAGFGTAINAGAGTQAAIAVGRRTDGQSDYLVARTAIDDLFSAHVLGRRGRF